MHPEVDATEAIVLKLMAAYPNANVTADTMGVYVEALADLDADVLLIAARKCLADCKWFPSVAELREAVNALTGPVMRSGLEAWGDVLQAVRKHGYLRAPVFDDPLVAQAVQAISWREICLSEEPMVVRAHFIKCYEQMVTRVHDDARQMPEVRQLSARRGQVAQIMSHVAARLNGRKEQP